VPSPPKPVEVWYAGYIDTAPLKPEQLDEIKAEAAKSCPNGRDVWFILVLSNYQYEGEWDYRAIVYFTPDNVSPRLREGRCLGVGSVPRRWRGAASRLRELLQQDATLSAYVQVSLPDKPFAGATDGLSNPVLPFHPPPDLSREDLVGVFDAARAVIGHGMRTDAGGGIHYTGDSKDRQLPVCHFQFGTDEIYVFFGWQVDPLAGSGVIVRVQKTREGFRADERVGRWVS
jgi:hypothetical protein